MRKELLKAQLKDSCSNKVITQYDSELDPYFSSKRKTGQPQPEKVIIGIAHDSFRLAPADGVLEYRQLLATMAMWVACIPDGTM